MKCPLFFLSETLKYFYLAFDANNPLNNDKERDWVFTTEAHPIHNVPRYEAKKNDNSYQMKQRMAIKLKNRILKDRILKKSQISKRSIEENPNVPISVQFETTVVDLENEKWSKSTTARQFIKDLEQTLDDSLNEDRQFSEVFGRVMKNNNTEVNFAMIEHNNFGRGTKLARSCPNYHHPSSLWIHAINGDQIAYTDLFVTSFHDVESTGTSEKILSALTSSALFGLSYMSNNDSICPFAERQRNQEREKYSYPTNVPPQGSQRLDMGEVGTFDISVYNGEGYYIKHVESGESVEATIIDKRPQHLEPFIAIESYIPVKVKKRKKNVLLLKLGSSFSMLKSVFARKTNNIVPKLIDTQHYDRTVKMSDLKGNTYSCRVEIIHATGESKKKDERSTFKKQNVIGDFTCLPATFGPTNLEILRQTNGISYETILYAPNEIDPHGCMIDAESSDDQSESRIELVHRGICNFRSKGLNLSKRHPTDAVLIINTEGDKLFVMAGPDEEGQDYSNEPASVLITKEDGEEMVQILENQKRKSGRHSQIFARVSLMPQSKEVDIVEEWPHVSSTTDTVQVLASQKWGVTAKKVNGHWSIFIVQHDAGKGKTDNIS
mmetsp:Transcript_9225/g.13715  ORF Transcript_9225/g.13715 Transcript_9225/m.13715 type:complete len:607 (+) Transcript_9225:1-1821(+)